MLTAYLFLFRDASDDAGLMSIARENHASDYYCGLGAR